MSSASADADPWRNPRSYYVTLGGIYSYTHTFMYTYIHTYIHSNIHTYIHTCTHTYMHSYYVTLGGICFATPNPKDISRIGEVISYVNGTEQLQSRETKVERGRRGCGFPDTLPCRAAVYFACGLLTIAYLHIAQELQHLFLPPYVMPYYNILQCNSIYYTIVFYNIL